MSREEELVLLRRSSIAGTMLYYGPAAELPIRRFEHSMTPYPNLGGKSGIVAYELAANSISVEFKNGSKYQYDYASAGAANVDQMKTLAQQGQGLGTFIDQVRPSYSKKWK